MKYWLIPILTITLAACSSGIDTPSLKKFASCDQMSNYLKSSLQKQIEVANMRTTQVTVSDAAAPTNESGGAPLEEGDITKIESGILVSKKANVVDVYDVSNPSSMRKITSIQIPDGLYPNELVLKNKILLVIASDVQGTKIISYDLHSEAPEKLKELELTAWYAQARVSASGDRALLVLNSGSLGSPYSFAKSGSSEKLSLANVNLSEVTTKLLGEQRIAASTTPICDCQNVSYVPDSVDPVMTSMTHIVSVSLDRNTNFKHELSFLGSSPVLRATADAFLLAIPVDKSIDQQGSGSTHLILAKDESGAIEAKAEARTDGFLKEQFNLNAAGDYIYAFTSLIKKSDYIYSSFVPAETVLKTFHIEGTKLTLVNTSKGVGQNEFLFSSLFAGDKAYAVTFKKTDPFYVFDLTNAAEPKILGELKIKGHSRQIREASKDTILAIGRDAEEQGDFALFKGVQVNLFQVNSSGIPSLKDRKIFGDRATRSDAAGVGYWSIGDESYKSYAFDDQVGTLLLPASFNGNNWDSGSASLQHTVQIFQVSDTLTQQPQIAGFTSYVDRVATMTNSYLAVSNNEIVSLSKKMPIHILQTLPR